MTVMSVPLSLCVSFCPCLPVSLHVHLSLYLSSFLPPYLSHSVFLLMSLQYILSLIFDFPRYLLRSPSPPTLLLFLIFSASLPASVCQPLHNFYPSFLPLHNYLLFSSLPLKLFFWPSQYAYLSTSLTLSLLLYLVISLSSSLFVFLPLVCHSLPRLSPPVFLPLYLSPLFTWFSLFLRLSLFFSCFSSSVLYQSSSLSTCLFPPLYLSLSILLSLSLLQVHLSLSSSLFTHFSLCLFTCLSSSFHSFQSTSLSLPRLLTVPLYFFYLSFFLSTCLIPPLSTYLSIHTFFCLLVSFSPFSLPDFLFLTIYLYVSSYHSSCLYLSVSLSFPPFLPLYLSLSSTVFLTFHFFSHPPNLPISLYSSSPVSSSSCLFLSFLSLFLLFYLSHSPTLFNCLSSFLFSSFSVSYLHLRPRSLPSDLLNCMWQREMCVRINHWTWTIKTSAISPLQTTR